MVEKNTKIVKYIIFLTIKNIDALGILGFKMATIGQVALFDSFWC